MPTSKTSNPRKHIAEMSKQHFGARRPAPVGLADGGFVDNAVKAMTNVFTRKRRVPEPEPTPAAPAQPAQQTMSLSNASGGMKSIMDKRKAQLDSYADGGLVRGPGTGTSDSIPKKVPRGAYIMPADSTKAIGADNLKKMGEAHVRLSNGEYEFPPEHVAAIGVDKLDAIKNATHTPVKMGARRGKVNGGVIPLLDEEEDELSSNAINPMSKTSPALGVAPLVSNRQSPAAIARAAAPAPTEPITAAPQSSALSTAGDLIAGGVKSIVGANRAALGATVDGTRNAVANLAGVELDDPLANVTPGADQMRQGATQFTDALGAAGQGVRGVVASALGGKVKPPVSPGVPRAGGVVSTANAQDLPPVTARVPRTEAQAQPNLGAKPSAQTTVDAAPTPQNTINVRRQANGNPEFSGNNIAGDAGYAGDRGIIGKMAGKGGVSTIEGGSGGRSTMEINQNASRILGEMSAVNDRYHQGYGAGRRRQPTGAEKLAQQKLAQEQAQGSAELGIKSTAANSDEQLKQGQIATMNKLQDLSRRFSESKDPAERKRLQEEYLVLSGKTPTQNKFTVVPGGQTVDPTTNAVIRDPSIVLDNETGRRLDLSGGAPAKAQTHPDGTTGTVNGQRVVWRNGVMVPA